MIAYCYSPECEQYSDLLPSNQGRSSLVHRLASAYKLLADEKVSILKPRAASRADLLTYHSEAYVDTILGKDVLSEEELARFGLEYDCAVFEGMEDYVRWIAGSSMHAARALMDPDNGIMTAVNWDGGRHHCKKGSAGGFCYVQDIVLAIQELRKTCQRVLYIDLDLHHGDGVEAAFLYSDKVFTLSLHRFDPGFFPNSGSFAEQGKGKGKGYNLNIPLRRGLSDASLIQLIDGIVIPTMETYLDPALGQAVVVQCGVDSLALDPCKEWNLSIAGYCAAIARIQDKARALNCKTLYLGGGGYNKTLASRCYTAILAQLVGRQLEDTIPEHSLWDEYADSVYTLAQDDHLPGLADANLQELSQLIAKSRLRLEQIKAPSFKVALNHAKDVPSSVDWTEELFGREVHGCIWKPTGRITNALVMMHGFGEDLVIQRMC